MMADAGFGTATPAGRMVTATAADIPVLAEVIAEAFLDLPPSRWLVPDRAERRRIWPGYFRIYVEHAMASGTVHTTQGRDAAALWIPAGENPPDLPEGYAAALAEVTGPYLDRFTEFDAALDQRHPTGFAHHYLAILAVRPTGRARAPAPRCWRPTTACSTRLSASPPTWKPPASGRAGSTCTAAIATTGRRSFCRAVPRCSPCSACLRSHPDPPRAAGRVPCSGHRPPACWPGQGTAP